MVRNSRFSCHTQYSVSKSRKRKSEREMCSNISTSVNCSDMLTVFVLCVVCTTRQRSISWKYVKLFHWKRIIVKYIRTYMYVCTIICKWRSHILLFLFFTRLNSCYLLCGTIFPSLLLFDKYDNFSSQLLFMDGSSEEFINISAHAIV
jgi:hypothetical protein